MVDSPLKVRLQQRAPIPLDVNLECAGSELLALVGPSGSGKSTVLRCIAGLNHANTPAIDRYWVVLAGGPPGLTIAFNLSLVGLV